MCIFVASVGCCGLQPWVNVLSKNMPVALWSCETRSVESLSRNPGRQESESPESARVIVIFVFTATRLLQRDVVLYLNETCRRISIQCATSIRRNRQGSWVILCGLGSDVELSRCLAILLGPLSQLCHFFASPRVFPWTWDCW